MKYLRPDAQRRKRRVTPLSQPLTLCECLQMLFRVCSAVHSAVQCRLVTVSCGRVAKAWLALAVAEAWSQVALYRGSCSPGVAYRAILVGLPC